MLSNIYCKLNKFDAKTEVVSEINAKLIVENHQNLAQMQKKYGEFFAVAALQHELQKKALKKIPSWIAAGCILDRRAYEQCTSEEVAIWKANFFKCKRLLSLTGGMGVDDWAWAKTGCEVTSVDNNEHLNCLVKFNYSKLGIQIDRKTTTAESFIEMHELNQFDLIYIDPDRREGNSRIVSKVNQYSPNIFGIIEQFPNNAFLLKLSPMVDSEFLSQSISRQMCFYSVVHQNEVKELLVYVAPSAGNVPQKKEMVHIEDGHYFYYNEFQATQKEEDWLIFEPNSGIFNLKLNRELTKASDSDTVSLNAQSTFFKTKTLYPKEMGRLFRPITGPELTGGLNKLSKILKEEYGVSEASITARECKMGTEEIRKTLKLKESDQYYLIITRVDTGFKAWLCQKFEY